MWTFFRDTKEDRANISINIMLIIFYSWLILLPLGLWKICDIIFFFINLMRY